MRSLRLIGAGLLLFAVVLALTALFAQPSYHWVGPTAALVFLPLWLAVAGINMWLGVTKAGYPASAEAPVVALVFGVPAIAAGVVWWLSSAAWDGGPVVHSGRTPLVLTTGVALWAGLAILASLFSVRALPAFIVLWTVLCAVNGALGVAFAGYTVGEEIPVFALNAAVPIAVALLHHWLTKRK